MTTALSSAGAVSIWLEVGLSVLVAGTFIAGAELLARRIDAKVKRRGAQG